MQGNGGPVGEKKFLGISLVGVPISLIFTAAMSAAGTAWAVNVAYFDLVARVSAVEAKNIEQDQHMTRMEQSQIQQKNDTAQQLRDISSDIKEVRNFLMANGASSRPDMKRWAR